MSLGVGGGGGGGRGAIRKLKHMKATCEAHGIFTRFMYRLPVFATLESILFVTPWLSPRGWRGA